MTAQIFRKIFRDANYRQAHRMITRWERDETRIAKIAMLALKYVIEKYAREVPSDGV